jgi:hypothetical protein
MEAPYSKVALSSGAQVSSHTSSYPAIFFTRLAESPAIPQVGDEQDYGPQERGLLAGRE